VAHLLLLVFPFAMAYAAAFDLLTMRIPNGVSLGIAAAFLVLAPIAGMPVQEMLMHLLVGTAVLIAGMILFGLRYVGGGDAKLLASGALWMGYDLLLAYRHTPADVLPLPTWAARLHNPGEGMPYGLAIAAGALVVYPLTAWPALLIA
jgi:prepilin peptidase CpaA